VYLQTQWFNPHLSHDEHICIHRRDKIYLIIDNAQGVDLILRRCLVHEEAKRVLNDFHARACGGHIYGMVTT
jgi:hypothetical protein